MRAQLRQQATALELPSEGRGCALRAREFRHSVLTRSEGRGRPQEAPADSPSPLSHCTSSCRRIVSASADRTLGIWRLHDGECECVFSGHKNWVHAVRAPPASLPPSASPVAPDGARVTVKSTPPPRTGVRPARRRAHHLRLRRQGERRRRRSSDRLLSGFSFTSRGAETTGAGRLG